MSDTPAVSDEAQAEAELPADLVPLASADVGTPDPNWPKPAEDGWTWRKIEVGCEACGSPNEFHAQRPEWVLDDDGVVWECRDCGHKHRIGGKAPELPPAGYLLECGECHNTYDPNTVDVGSDGSWTCPTDRAGCGTPNRTIIAAGEGASAAQSGSVS